MKQTEPSQAVAPGRETGSLLSVLRGDLPASLVVVLLAIPLSLGIALASGMPLLSGLIAAAVGGIVVGIFGGAPLQVSGPAVGLTVVIATLALRFDPRLVCGMVLLAGVFQIALGMLKIARGALAISPAVIHGTLAGIGATIALEQLHEILGGQPEVSALRNLRELPAQLMDIHGPAAFLGLATIAVLAAGSLMPRKLRFLPVPLIAVVAMTLASELFLLNVRRLELPENLWATHLRPAFPESGQWGVFVLGALAIALLATIESLLSTVAMDHLRASNTDSQRLHLDRELVAQGAANVLSGLLGGLPITGVIVRTTAAVEAGARTRWASVLHGVWIVVFILAFGSSVERIPRAVLAGLLLYVGLRLVRLQTISTLTHHREVPVYIVTALSVALINLPVGIGVGVGLSIFLTLRRLANTKATVESKNGRYHVRLEGSLTFASVPQLLRALEAVPQGASVDVDLAVDFLDHAAFEALHGWRTEHTRRGGRVDIDERHEDWYTSAVEGRPRVERSNPLSSLSTLLFGRRRGAADAAGTGPEATQSLLDGIDTFQRSGAETVRPLFEALAHGQHPEALFITCCDSRVVPTLFTASGPGDLFKVRNIGNIIPVSTPMGNGEVPPAHSVGAALEYAIGVLNVSSVVVCGHSACGAMKALLSEADLSATPHLSNWLSHARESLIRYKAAGGGNPETAAGIEPVDRLAQINVAQQLENLRSYQVVVDAERDGRVRLIGMFFDIERARVSLYDESEKVFRVAGTTEWVVATE